MNDGTTPLMLAARLAIEGVVEELVAADTTDINAADEYGKCQPVPKRGVNPYHDGGILATLYILYTVKPAVFTAPFLVTVRYLGTRSPDCKNTHLSLCC